jgi:hypothetical protein
LRHAFATHLLEAHGFASNPGVARS